MRAHNQWLGNRAQAPASGNPLNLTGGILSVTSRANQAGIGAAVDFFQCRVVAPVKEILHQAGDCAEIFWCRKNIAISSKNVLWHSLHGMLHMDPYATLCGRTLGEGMCQLLGSTSHRVENQQQRFLDSHSG